jgi:formylglycine-generating enzyme
MNASRALWVGWLFLGLLAGAASATVNIETVPVGNPGNTPDTRYNSIAVGGVAHSYQMGKYDVTAGQYTAFLNAVAATDTYGLYSTYMDTANYYQGCNIKRSGSEGSYTYTVAADWANRPVNCVSWGDAARFANWLSNGQPTGGQNASTTEDGSYYLNGATSSAALMAVTRKHGATWVLPTEDEWYKAAYYDPNKPGGPGYWDYPTRSNTVPSNVLNPSGTNNANSAIGGYGTIGAPYYRTEVGAFASSPSPYGTYDQGGNVWQWNETNVFGRRGVRGGSYTNSGPGLRASARGTADPTDYSPDYGFRVSQVPEPTTLAIFALGAVGLLRKRRTRAE